MIQVYALLTAGLATQALALESQLPQTPDTAAIRLALVDALYAEGRYKAAQALLNRMTLQSDEALSLARSERLTRVGIRLNEYDNAALPLADAQSRTELQPIQRYNLGIAWLGAGAGSKGASELNWVGSSPIAPGGHSIIPPYLADRANLSLGYWLLGQEKHAAAASVLRRVRLDSPVAAQAMLGLGWAEYHHDETGQALTASTREDCQPVDPALWRDSSELHSVSRTLCREIQTAADAPGLDQITGYASAETGYRKAVVMWQTITRGDARNLVVAEALANLPHALAKSGDRQAAQLAADQAARRLRQAIADIETGQDLVSPNDLTPRQRRLADEAALLKAVRTRLLKQKPTIHPILTAVGEVLASRQRTPKPPELTPAQRGLLRAFIEGEKTNAYPSPGLPAALGERRQALVQRIDSLIPVISQFESRLQKATAEARIESLKHYEATVRLFLASLAGAS